jgi:hypothetical protein
MRSIRIATVGFRDYERAIIEQAAREIQKDFAEQLKIESFRNSNSEEYDLVLISATALRHPATWIARVVDLRRLSAKDAIAEVRDALYALICELQLRSMGAIKT